MIDYTINTYDNWVNVFDFKSDETTVTLKDKNNIALAVFNYHQFTTDDFKNLKDKNGDN